MVFFNHAYSISYIIINFFSSKAALLHNNCTKIVCNERIHSAVHNKKIKSNNFTGTLGNGRALGTLCERPWSPVGVVVQRLSLGLKIYGRKLFFAIGNVIVRICNTLVWIVCRGIYCYIDFVTFWRYFW